MPRVIVTDKPGSCQVAPRELLGPVEHRRSKYLNNRAENSLNRPRSANGRRTASNHPGHAQRFLSAFSGISSHFQPRLHRLSATPSRSEMADRFAAWREISATDVAA